MTEKLFYQDAYCREFEAKVLRCSERKDGYEVVLDRTAFYPEGGGQPGDIGELFGKDSEAAVARVWDTHEKNGEILHYTDQPVEPGTGIRGKIDWEHRFDLMQNHSGEHIVSGLINEKFGYHNVGFHMGKDRITIDLDGEFSAEDMQEFELRANEIVWKNAPVIVKNYSEEEAKDLEYRSKKELHGTIRIVSFEGADICACCGTHVRSAGEIGLIKLISLEKFKGGMRMEMLSGKRAYQYVAAVCAQNQRISVALSAKPMETANAVERLKAAEAAAVYKIGGMQEKLFAQRAQQMAGAGDVLLFEEDLTSDGVRKLAAAVMETCGGRCVVCSGDDASGYKYAVGEKDGDLRGLIKEFNNSCHGRGGGKPFFAQGSVSAARQEIEKFWIS